MAGGGGRHHELPAAEGALDGQERDADLVQEAVRQPVEQPLPRGFGGLNIIFMYIYIHIFIDIYIYIYMHVCIYIYI